MIKKKPADGEGLRDWRKPVRVDGPAAAAEPACHLVVGFDRYPASRGALSFAMGLAVPRHRRPGAECECSLLPPRLPDTRNDHRTLPSP